MPAKNLSGRRIAIGLLTVLGVCDALPALAVPSFARQTGMACEACHTVFPELTHFGRTFKANGYVLDNLRQVRGIDAKRDELLDLSQTPPISIMIQVSDTQLRTAIPDISSPDYNNARSQNGTVGFPQQISIFYAGKIAPRVGAYLQLTYANDSGTIRIDNTDLRFANLVVLPHDGSLVYGLSLNNNPTVEDLWNSTPAWSFPYASTNAGVSPLAGTQIDNGLAQSVAGLTAYLYWNESLYVEFGPYRSAKQGAANTLTGQAGPLDGAASNVISGLAPYFRLAYEYNWSRHSIEAGVYGLEVKLFPGAALGTPTPLAGLTNRFRDVAEDLQYQFLGDENLFTVAATRIHENMSLDASYAAGTVSNPADSLTTARLFATYYFRRKIGGTAGWFSTTGSSDAGLYPSAGAGSGGVVTSANNAPDTRGFVAEVNYLPWLNTKLSLQYTAYTRFNGGSTNYDGVGRNASANDTLYALVWFAY